MAIPFNDNLQVNAPKDVDARKGKIVSGQSVPYDTVAEALIDPKLTRLARFSTMYFWVWGSDGKAEKWGWETNALEDEDVALITTQGSATPVDTETVVPTAGVLNNLSTPTGFIRLTGTTTASVLSGLAGVLDGKEVKIVNSTGTNISVLNGSSSSATGNRLILKGAIDCYVFPNASITFKYSPTLAAWIETEQFGTPYSDEFIGTGTRTLETLPTGYIQTADSLELRTLNTIRATPYFDPATPDYTAINTAYPDHRFGMEVICTLIKIVYEKIDDINGAWTWYKLESDGEGSTPITASNGLTKVGDDITLGGDYTGVIQIGYDRSVVPSIILNSFGGSGIMYKDSYLLVNPDGLGAKIKGKNSVFGISSAQGFVVTDGDNSRGLTESEDYSANKTEFSYVTKKMLTQETIQKITDTQRLAIVSPTEGLTIYNITSHKLNFYNGTAWEQTTSALI